MIEQVPEFYDGGYWYAAPVVQDARGNWRPAADMPAGFCCDYGEIAGVRYAFFRRPIPCAVPNASVSANQVVSAAGYTEKPEFRVGGA
jgi:hypothetical protein